MFGLIAQYTLLSLFGLGVITAGSTDNLDVGCKFRTQYFTHMTKNPFYVEVPAAYIPIAMIQVQTKWTAFKVIDFNLGMRGFSGAGGGFKTGIGGGNWGADLILSKYLKFGYKHESLHAFDSAYKAGSEDYIYFEITYNMDKRKGILEYLLK